MKGVSRITDPRCGRPHFRVLVRHEGEICGPKRFYFEDCGGETAAELRAKALAIEFHRELGKPLNERHGLTRPALVEARPGVFRVTYTPEKGTTRRRFFSAKRHGSRAQARAAAQKLADWAEVSFYHV